LVHILIKAQEFEELEIKADQKSWNAYEKMVVEKFEKKNSTLDLKFVKKATFY
jgi:hypothetical protein